MTSDYVFFRLTIRRNTIIHLLTWLAIIVKAALFSPLSHAKLISTPLGLLDTTTNLEWLRITYTAGQSYDSIINGYGRYIASGWRYASSSDLHVLYDNAGGDPSFYNGPTSYANHEPADILITLLGHTGSSNGIDWQLYNLKGLTSDSVAPNSHSSGFIQVEYGNSPEGYLYTTLYNYWDHYSGAELGSFMVRDNYVPEPSGIMLLIIGFLCFTVTRKIAGKRAM